MPTEAQEEFQAFVDKNTRESDGDRNIHPEDRHDAELEDADLDEEDEHRADAIDATMRMPAQKDSGGGAYKLPPASFDNGRATGVKGVIADARDYETSRKTSFRTKVRQARRSVFGMGQLLNGGGGDETALKKSGDNPSSSDEEELDEDEEEFLAQWRESRRRQMEEEDNTNTNNSNKIRTRRTSPSVRIYGRLDTVDALGYLDAIEKVGRETVVLVYVHDDECQVSSAVEEALRPLVRSFPAVHFVKVHYDDIEFDNAAVPAILAYRNQGDLFANLTGLIQMMPDEEFLTTEALQALLHQHDVL